jgi:hypothetical protein
MKKYTQTDLEDAIYMMWQTSDDLDLFFRYHGDAETPMTEDEVANTILGIKNLNHMRGWNAMDMYCRVNELNQYCTDPDKLAAREALAFYVEDYSNPVKKKKAKKK